MGDKCALPVVPKAASWCRIVALEISIFLAWLSLHLVNVVLIVMQCTWQRFKDCAHSTSPKSEVVVVGASFGGLAVQRELAGRKDINVTLVDFKEYFEYTPGILRCFVDPGYLGSLTCRLPQRRNKLILGEVVDASPTSVAIQQVDGSRRDVAFDYLVLACGSTYQEPIKPVVTEPTLEQRRMSWARASDKLRKAGRVIVVGAGAVGVELVGEILTQFPKKTVTIVDMSTAILPGFGPKCVEHATSWLRRMGAELRLGEAIQDIGADSITLKSEEVLYADVVYKCIGVMPNTCMVKRAPEFAAALGFRDSLNVNDHLQVGSCKNVFCVGDMMSHSSRELKLGHTAELNGHLAAHNILASVQGGALMKYPEGVVGAAVTPTLYALSLGKYDASLGFNWLVINGFLAAFVKWLLEWTKVMAAAEQPVGVLFWVVADAISLFLGRSLLKQQF